jgi:hypothetical protein
VVEQAPKLEGNSMTMVLAPVRRAKSAMADQEHED